MDLTIENLNLRLIELERNREMKLSDKGVNLSFLCQVQTPCSPSASALQAAGAHHGCRPHLPVGGSGDGGGAAGAAATAATTGAAAAAATTATGPSVALRYLGFKGHLV